MASWQGLLAIAVGGGAGSLVRYAVTFAITQRIGAGFPLATLLINLTGCFLIGVVFEVTQTRAIAASPVLRLGLMTGVLGGYTTFSTFGLDTVNLVGSRLDLAALAYVAASVVGGIALAYAGVVVARAF